jgi:hypothetical protein
MTTSNLESGGCFCGAVRFEFPRTELISSHHCHCKDCQRSKGSGFATFCLLPRNALRVLKDDIKFFEVRGDSGGTVSRGFYPSCGSHLISYASSRPDLALIKAGALDRSDWLAPLSSLCASSAQPWAKPVSGIPAFVKGFKSEPAE